VAKIQKRADQAEKTSIAKTNEAAKEGGVIVGQPNQEVHGKAFEQAHQNDKTLSEPDMIAMKEIFEVTTDLRNQAKRQARDLMKDRLEAKN
jgi:rRNA maturation endonuclease Nob1